jgi:uncharacterized phiE125 gp8 family phage protein
MNKYGLVQVVAPVREPLTLEEAKQHLRIDHANEDSLILALITAVRHRAENETNRLFITQDWKMTLGEFCYDVIELPRSPIQSIQSIQYVDTDEAAQTLDYTLYELDNSTLPARVYPAYSETWPSTLMTPAAVSITFRAGYGDYPRDVPEDVRAAMKLMLGHYYENREEVVLGAGNTVNALPKAVEALLARICAQEFR